MAYIGKQPTVGNFVKLDAITTSATATYNLTNGGVAYSPQSANHCLVSLNGVIQEPTSASNVGGFTISGSTIVFTSALTSSDVIDFILVLGDVLNIGTPSDGTVTTPKLASGITTTHALGSAGTPSITFTGDTNTGIFSPTADTIAFTEGGSEAMRIDSSGNVGIGTNSPAFSSGSGVEIERAGVATLRVDNSTSTAAGEFRADATGTAIDCRGLEVFRTLTGGSERMRITSAGAVCINSTTSAISGITDGYIGIDISNASRTGININSVTENQPAIGIRKHNSSGTSYPLYMLNAANSNVGSVSMTNSAVAFNTSSDYRLKENVTYNFDATTRLKQLKPARFNFILEPNKTVDGFLAHEVSNIIPEAITGTKDQVEAIGNITDVEGNIIKENFTEPSKLPENQTWTQTGTRPVYQGIDQSKLTPILTKALQEAIAKIEQLEARLTALENN